MGRALLDSATADTRTFGARIRRSYATLKKAEHTFSELMQAMRSSRAALLTFHCKYVKCAPKVHRVFCVVRSLTRTKLKFRSRLQAGTCVTCRSDADHRCVTQARRVQLCRPDDRSVPRGPPALLAGFTAHRHMSTSRMPAERRARPSA